jgi:hypothetical protein
MTDDPTKFTTEGAVVAGHRIKLVTEAENGTETAEKEAEKIHMDLKARMQQLDEAVSDQDVHPDDVTPFMSVNWSGVLDLKEEGGGDDGE